MFASKDALFAKSSGSYQISRSLRFRSSASAYLSRTPASAGTRTTWTYSCWVKRGALSNGNLFHAPNTISGTAHTWCAFSSDSINFYDYTGSAYNFIRISTQVFRDPSAWYHIVFVVDSNNATAQNRARIYINGSEITAWSTNTTGAPGFSTAWNNNILNQISSQSGYFDGYMAEVNFIDGAAKTPTDFGAFDTNGIWQPAAYTGSYGTNGFYLKFTDVGATASPNNTGYGKDFSGNGNYWTTNNFGTTSTGTSAPSYDSMLDSPTNAAGDIGNYAVWSPLVLFPNTTNQSTMSNGNLLMTRSAGGLGGAVTTIGATSGKYYAEVTVTAVGTSVPRVAVIADNNPPSINSANEYYPGGGTTSVAYRSDGGKTYNNSTIASWGSTYTTNDVIGIAFDADSGKVWFGKQTGGTGSMTWQASGDPAAGTNPANTLGTGVPFYFSAGGESGVQMSFNTGQRPLSATAPSGFSALNTQNLTTPTITNGASYMAASLWTGTGSATTIPLGSFTPDLVWWKCRSNAEDHHLIDTVRGKNGGTYYASLSSNLTAAEDNTSSGDIVTNISSSGLTVDNLNGTPNVNGRTYVGWNWKAGGTSVVNNVGTIQSNVSANTSAGFSVVTGVSTSTTGSASVGHGLNVTPSMVIFKNRDIADDWYTWHTSLGSSTAGNYIRLNTTAAATSSANIWGGTGYGMTSTTLGLNQSAFFSASNQKFVFYAFAAVASYSSFGIYTGNGSSDGPFVYTGFRPRFIIIKRTDAANDWVMYDSSRAIYNVNNIVLAANSSSNEATYSSGYNLDFVSNGVKMRDGPSGAINTSGGTYIYAAFAENPFKYSRAR